jgi:hypothetical protein
MKKYIFSTVCVLFLTLNLFSQNPITRDEAYKIIIDKGIINIGNDAVYGSKETIQPNTTLKGYIQNYIQSPNFNSWVFLIDLDYSSPSIDHARKFVFVNTLDKSISIIESQVYIFLEVDILDIPKKYYVPNPPMKIRKNKQQSKTSNFMQY